MRWLELIEDSQGKLSTPSGVVWVGVIVLSMQVIIDAVNVSTNETVIGIYAGLIAAVYGIKKGFDSSVEKATVKANSPVVNVANIENAEKLTGTGNVNVNN